MSGSEGLRGMRVPLRSAPLPPPKKKPPPPRPPPPRPQRSTSPLLIDLSSPPGSPAPLPHSHSRSNADGLSVDSFGSAASSRVESGFEDDFDAFSDSRTDSPPDPFSPTRALRRAVASRTVYDAAEFPDRLCNGAAVRCKPQIRSAPTVIRAKPAKPARPKPPQISRELDTGDGSPPMPTVPPPPPPPNLEVLELFEVEQYIHEDPYAVALFDFPGSHSDDLPFRVDDKIRLLRKVNDEWLFGKLRSGVEGMFPANFVDVKVPLPAEKEWWATALYDFMSGEAGDLDFKSGARVKLLYRVNDDWLCGESGGRSGQFPSVYVDSSPSDLPRGPP